MGREAPIPVVEGWVYTQPGKGERRKRKQARKEGRRRGEGKAHALGEESKDTPPRPTASWPEGPNRRPPGGSRPEPARAYARAKPRKDPSWEIKREKYRA